MLSMEVSFWDKKPKAFYSALASAPLSDDLFALGMLRPLLTSLLLLLD